MAKCGKLPRETARRHLLALLAARGRVCVKGLALPAALVVLLALAVPVQAATSRDAGTGTHARGALASAHKLRHIGHLTITPRALPEAVLNQPYSAQFHVLGHHRVSWAALGSLPAGLSLDPATGVLSGLPAAAGSSEVLVSASSAGRDRAAGYADVVLTVEQPNITNVLVQRVGQASNALPVLRVWGSGFGTEPAASGLRPECPVGLGAAREPAGLQVRDASGSAGYGAGPGCAALVVQSWTDHEIVATLGAGRGRPAGPAVGPSDRLSVLVDGARWTGRATILPAATRLRILSAPASALTGSVGIPFRLTLASAAGPTAPTWTITSGRLPSGLVLDRSAGVIDGTPLSAGSATVTIQAAGPGFGRARAQITLTVSANVTVPEPTVASSLYQSLYFGKLGSGPELENLLLADVAARTYADDPAASSATVSSELAALKTAFGKTTNPLVPRTGTGLASFGPNLVPQLTGALGVMTSFAGSGQAPVIKNGLLDAASSIYQQYLQSNLANAIGYGQGYAGFSDRTLYDTGDLTGTAFHELVSAPLVAGAVSCGQASAGCASVLNSLLEPVTGVSVAATPSQLISADPSLGTMLNDLGLTVTPDGTITTSAASYDDALNTAASLQYTTATKESSDVASLIAMAGDPDAPTDPSATSAASAQFIAATFPDLTLTLDESTFLAAIGNTVTPKNGNSAASTLLSGTNIAQGANFLLKALGSNDATQDTEISDTIGTFVDICTGNFTDAIKNVFGLLSAASGGHDETYTLAMQIEGMIQNVYNNLSAQLQQVQSSLNAIGTTLINLYQTMISDFAYVNFELHTVSNQMAAAIVQLNQLQYSVDVTDQNLLNITAASVNGKIQGDFNDCLDYASRFPNLPPLTAGAFQTCEGDFKTDATSTGVASNPGVEYQIPGPYDNATIAKNLQPGYDVSANLLYLLTILNARWPADAAAPPANLVNPDVWAEAALGYRELLDENPAYSAGPEPDTAAVELPGQQVAAAIGALQAVNSSGQSPVVNDVANNYASALSTLVSDVNIHQAKFSAKFPAWDGYDAFGSTEQALPSSSDDPNQQISGMPLCGETSGDAVALPAATPWESGVNPPNSWYLVYDIGAQAQSGYQPTSSPLCVDYSSKETGISCNPKTAICTVTYKQSGSITFQYLGLDGKLHTIETVSTPTNTTGCVQPGPACNTPNLYFNNLITADGSLQQLLINIGAQSATKDNAGLEADANTILVAEQKAVYSWDLDGFTNSGDDDYGTLTADVNSLAGAFELLQATAQTVAPSASLGNEALSDILYGNDELASYLGSPNNPAALFHALAANPQGAMTFGAWSTAQSTRLTEAQTLLNGYLASAASGAAGTLSTAEAPDLTLSALVQLNTGLELGQHLVAPAITSAASATFHAGTFGSFQVAASGRPGPAFSETGKLPAGLTFTSAGLLSGTPAATSGGVYHLTITAANSISPAATQKFTLTVRQSPAITVSGRTTVTLGKPVKLTIRATGYPAPTLTWTGKLPAGVKVTKGKGDTLIVSGTVSHNARTGNYKITVKAVSSAGKATKPITLTVKK